MKKYEVWKTNRRAKWTREAEYRSETLTVTASGTARIVENNGGWGGAWDARQFRGAEPRIISLEEAWAELSTWGIPDDEIESVRALKPWAPAVTP